MKALHHCICYSAKLLPTHLATATQLQCCSTNPSPLLPCFLLATSKAAPPATMDASHLSLCPVVAATTLGGIGNNGSLPWRIPAEMKHFRSVTSTVELPNGASPPAEARNAVVMGRRTFMSIPPQHRPLKNRVNVVLTSNADFASEQKLPEGDSDGSILVASSLDDALSKLSAVPAVAAAGGRVYVAGGASVYREALVHPQCNDMYLTRIELSATGKALPSCDTSMPELAEGSKALASWELRSSTSPTPAAELQWSVQYLVRKKAGTQQSPSKEATPGGVTSSPGGGAGGGAGAGSVVAPSAPLAAAAASSVSSPHEEVQYLDLIRDILANGVKRGDRTGTGTLSKFGVQMRFSLRDKVLPLLTTKRVFWRGVAEELLWFISGSTDARKLQEKRIRIWDGNASREFLDQRGLTHREVGDLGPVYGFQWRHFGAKYVDFNTDYTGQGVDQLARCIETIKTNPNDRRIVMSAWNPADLDQMALPPCHMFCQFYVANGELSCQMYQRSADMGLGVPFNIASYALLTRLMAQVCGLKAGDFVHCIGDAHVYLNHVEPLKQQLERTPRPFPTLDIDPSVTDIDGFQFDHFTVNGYKPHKSIKMKMAV